MSSKVAFLASLAASMVAPAWGQISIMSDGVGANNGGVPLAGARGPVSDGMAGWGVWPDSKFQYFGAEYYTTDFEAFVPTQVTIPSGAMGTFTCPSTATACDVIVYLYQCYPCESKKGDLPRLLLAEGYSRTRCGPSFSTGSASMYLHKMSAYVKSIPGNTQEVLTLPEEVEYAFFALKLDNSVECTALNPGPQTCMAPGNNGLCKTAVNKCAYSTCTTGPSPSNGCDMNMCVANDLPF